MYNETYIRELPTYRTVAKIVEKPNGDKELYEMLSFRLLARYSRSQNRTFDAFFNPKFEGECLAYFIR